MGLEDLLFAAEYDGELYHSDDEDLEHDEKRREWLARNRSWVIEDFRKANVFGQHQDATERLAAAYRECRASIGERCIII